MVYHCNEVLRENGIAQAIFDRSVEFQNDSDVLLAIEQLTLEEGNLELNLDKAVVLQVVDFYNRAYKIAIEATDPRRFDSHVLIAQLEDKVYAEFSLELNDLVQNYLNSEDCDISMMMSQFRQSFTSVQKLRQSIFESNKKTGNLR
jgi:hypothetical protein